MKKLWSIAVLLLLSTYGAQAQEKQVRIGVLGLFHTKEVVVSSLPGRLLDCATGEDRWPVREPLRLVLAETMIRIEDGHRSATGSFTCDNGQSGPAEFTVSIPGKIS